jgi:pimeloyl-ACP methyl ester carboxylesterase
MDQALYKTTTTTRLYQYNHYISPTRGARGHIVLLHGFPEYANVWTKQVGILEDIGYNCIASDLLGYGASSKPIVAEAYNSEGLTQDVADIMTAENVENAVLIGHDWGSYLAGRFANWQSSRTSGLVLTSVSYRPSGKLDLATSNAQMKAAFWYEPFGYWEWIASQEAPQLLESHLRCFLRVI